MKVKVENVTLFYYCKSHKTESCQCDIQELWDFGTPECSQCEKPMILKKECLIST